MLHFSFRCFWMTVICSPEHWRGQSRRGREVCSSKWAGFSLWGGWRQRSCRGRDRTSLRRSLMLHREPRWTSFLAQWLLLTEVGWCIHSLASLPRAIYVELQDQINGTVHFISSQNFDRHRCPQEFLKMDWNLKRLKLVFSYTRLFRKRI